MRIGNLMSGLSHPLHPCRHIYDLHIHSHLSFIVLRTLHLARSLIGYQPCRPPGVFEFPAFAKGSESLLDATIEAVQKGATVIVGGGDTATVVVQYGKDDKLSHVSTGGGASLELLEGKVSYILRSGSLIDESHNCGCRPCLEWLSSVKKTSLI